MEPTKTNYAIIGGGRAGAIAAQTFIEEGVPGSEILLVAYEPELPYNRPPLSKGYLVGKESRDSLLIQPKSFYEEHGINLKLGTKVTELHAKEGRFHTEFEEEIEFEQLLIATGARPRKLKFPGSDLDNIIYLRTILDSDKLKAAAMGAKNAVIVGGGFIGLEAAATLTGLGVKVTILHRGEQLLDKFATSELAQFFHDYFTDQGVTIRYEITLDHCLGTDQVQKVVTNTGEHLPADLVLVGIGVELCLDFLKNEDIRVSNGVIVDEELETAVPGIFAAGDIINFPDEMFGGRHRRIEHWDHAEASGRAAARNMLGRHEPFKHLSYFFSDMFDLSFDLWGDTDAPEDSLFYSDTSKKTAACWYLRDGAVSAYFAINRPDAEKERAQEFITNHTRMTKEELVQ